MDKDIASLKRTKGKFQELNQKMEEKARELAEEIKLEENDLGGLEEEVDELEETLFRKMEQSNELIWFHQVYLSVPLQVVGCNGRRS